MAWDHNDLITDSLQLDTGHQFDGIWIDEYAVGDILLEASGAQVGNYAIKQIADLDPEFWVNYFWFLLESPQDFSSYETAEVWIKWPDYDAVDPYGPGQQGFGFIDSNEKVAYWELEYILTDSEWHKCKFSFSNFDGVEESGFDITTVDRILLQLFYDFDVDPPRDWEAQLDGIVFYSEREWDASTNTLWSEATNWTGDNVPDQVDEYSFFTGSVTNDDCLITPGVTSPGGLTIESDYTGTVYSPDEASYWGNPKMNISIAGGALQASGASLGFAGSSLVITGGVFNSPFYSITDATSMIQIADGITLDSLYFHQNGSTLLASDVAVQNDISFGTGGAISILDLYTHELSASGDLFTGDGAVDFTLDVEDLSTLSVNSAYFGNEDNGTVMTIGASGGVPWDYDGSGDMLRLSTPSVASSVKFFGPSVGGSVTAPSATLEVYDGGEFYSYGGDVILGQIYVGSGGVLNIDGGSLTLYGDVYSEGYIYADVDVTNIFATTDVLLEGAGFWNLNVDSGGNNITVTVSGGTIYGKVDVASGDTVVLTGGADWAQAQVKWNKTVDNKWKEADNWQLNHIPEADDIAWFDGSSLEFCHIMDEPVTIPKEILIGPDYKGSNAILVNRTDVWSWGGPNMKLTILGALGDSVLICPNYNRGLTAGDLYMERGSFGGGNGSNLNLYGDLYFTGEVIDKLYSYGTDNRTWYFDTRDPYDDNSPYHGYNSISRIDLRHTEGILTIEGELHDSTTFNSPGLVDHGEDRRVHIDAQLYLYQSIFSNYPWEVKTNIYFTMASGSKILHASPEDFTIHPGFFTTGEEGADHYKFELGASGSGLWDFESYWSGQYSYGGYGHRLYWGHVIGMMPRWHQKPHYPEYAILYGMAPGHSWVSHNCGLHIGVSGQFLNYGGDIEVPWFEVTEQGYFDQADGKLTLTGRAKNGDWGEPWAPGEPDIDHKWAAWSKGTWVWTPGASVEITATEDVELWNVDLPPLTIDSGGNEITVTASGCTFNAETNIAEGDRLIIISEDPVTKEIIPKLGITRKVGDYLVTELTVKMERD